MLSRDNPGRGDSDIAHLLGMIMVCSARSLGSPAIERSVGCLGAMPRDAQERLRGVGREVPALPRWIRCSEDSATGKAEGRWIARRGASGSNMKRAHTEQNSCSPHTVVRLAPPLGAVKKTRTVDRAQNGTDSVSVVWHDAATASARIS